MTPADLNLRLLRIQAHLENHDEHHLDCDCHFCNALDEVALLRSDLRISQARRGPSLAEERLEELGAKKSGTRLQDVS